VLEVVKAKGRKGARVKSNKAQKVTRGRPALTATEMALKREAIATAARALFAAEGYSAVSIRNVAEAAEMTPMTLYRYFDSKVDVLRYLWADVLNAHFDSLDAIAKRERDKTKRLEKVSIAYVRYWIEHPDHYRLVFLSEGISQPAVNTFLHGKDVLTRYALFSRCVADALQSDDVSAETELLISSLHGIAQNHITISGYSWTEPQVLIRLLIGMLTNTDG
jgi:AcrR family transcriptional regulator